MEVDYLECRFQKILTLSIGLFLLTFFACNVQRAPIQKETVAPIQEDQVLAPSIKLTELPFDTLEFLKGEIESIKKNINSYEFLRLDYLFVPGGGLSGYFENEELIWSTNYHSGERGGVGLDFFLKNDTLLAIIEYRTAYEELDKGFWDPSQKTRTEEKITYLYDRQVIHSDIFTIAKEDSAYTPRFNEISDLRKDIDLIKVELIKYRISRLKE